MSVADREQGVAAPLHLQLPATSANLGPGFDALGLALSLLLHIEARPAATFSIRASGRDAALIGSTSDNLILETYKEILREQQVFAPALALQVVNEIPLGMGCGSSAAALCGGVLLASHFGHLAWSTAQLLDEAARREGHPDNVAACLMGGLTSSRTIPSEADGQPSHTVAASLGHDLGWRVLLALPTHALATSKARALLPDRYTRADTVSNLQAVSLLVTAFALNRPDLLRTATEDRVHQPFRMEACPLLARLLPLCNSPDVWSVTLSGAGPSVLVLASAEFSPDVLRETGGDLLEEVVELHIGRGAVSTIHNQGSTPSAGSSEISKSVIAR